MIIFQFLLSWHLQKLKKKKKNASTRIISKRKINANRIDNFKSLLNRTEQEMIHSKGILSKANINKSKWIWSIWIKANILPRPRITKGTKKLYKTKEKVYNEFVKVITKSMDIYLKKFLKFEKLFYLKQIEQILELR